MCAEEFSAPLGSGAALLRVQRVVFENNVCDEFIIHSDDGIDSDYGGQNIDSEDESFDGTFTRTFFDDALQPSVSLRDQKQFAQDRYFRTRRFLGRCDDDISPMPFLRVSGDG